MKKVRKERNNEKKLMKKLEDDMSYSANCRSEQKKVENEQTNNTKERPTDGWTRQFRDRQTVKQHNGETDRQTDEQDNGETDRRTNKTTEKPRRTDRARRLESNLSTRPVDDRHGRNWHPQ